VSAHEFCHNVSRFLLLCSLRALEGRNLLAAGNEVKHCVAAPTLSLFLSRQKARLSALGFKLEKNERFLPAQRSNFRPVW